MYAVVGFVKKASGNEDDHYFLFGKRTLSLIKGLYAGIGGHGTFYIEYKHRRPILSLADPTGSSVAVYEIQDDNNLLK
jgi:hypothetical protein